MSSSFIKKALLTGVTLAVVGGGIYMLLKPDHPAGGDMAHGGMPGGEMPVMPAKVAVIAEQSLRLWSSYSGRLEAVDFVELRPQVDGRIDEIKFEDGQVVNKDDILFVIDPRPYKAAVAEAEAAVKAAQSQNELTSKELKRAEDLIKTEAISEKTLDERRNAAQLAKNLLSGTTALLDQAKVNLDRAYLKAPITGRISRPEITVGNVVQSSNAPVLSTIVSHEGIYADFEVDEQTYLKTIQRQAGDNLAERAIPVQMILNNNSSKTYQGYIKSFDNRIDTSSGTIRARAYLDNDGTLLPGMFVTVRLGSPAEENVILLTEQAISTDQDRKFVYVVDEAGAVAYREVMLGAAVGGQRVIVSGLQPGEQVIIEGVVKIHPGMTVAPQIAAAETPASEQIAPPPAIEPAAEEIPIEEPAVEETVAEDPVAEEIPETETPAPTPLLPAVEDALKAEESPMESPADIQTETPPAAE